tara:strand:+ start:7310 stop:8695 length:1386 start_codon:yes stop_codon:yes gene_type:complete
MDTPANFTNPNLERRRFLRGLGALVALPTFESLLPAKAFAASAQAGRAVTETGAPMRMGFVYIPNGVNVKNWAPTGTGRDYQLGKTLQPIADFRNDFQVISKLMHDNGWGKKDGGGDHARANATFLTGARPRKTAGSDIQLGISVDQVAANHIGDLTRLSSLELTCASVRTAGRCDSGYSCAYQFNLSWRSDTTPMTPEPDPRLVFERLFGQGQGSERKLNFQRRQEQQRSVLDYVMEDAQSLNGQLGRNDQQKLDEYLTGVREIEKKIEKAERFPLPDPGVAAPSGKPSDKKEYIRLMYDMMILAFQTDSTRVASFLQANDGDNRSYEDIGVSEGHHTLSHHQEKPDKLAKIAKIDLWYMEQFNYFLTRMRETKDVDGNSLLHNSMIVYGGGLSNGQRHAHDNLPVILAGKAGGKLKAGQHLDPGSDVPMTNLYLSMLDTLGVPDQERIGDSTGRLTGIS